MSDDRFLARWSRRKQQQAAEERTAALAQEKPSEQAPAEANPAEPAPLSADDIAERLKALPRVEDLTAEHDVAAFMQAWVPEELRNRALRRAWSVDPAIRDFIAPESERYDFDKPGAMFSHGAFELDQEQLREMAEGLLGGSRRIAQAKAEAERKMQQPEIGETGETGNEPPEIAADIPAPQHSAEPAKAGPNKADISSAPQAAKRHGGATPQ